VTNFGLNYGRSVMNGKKLQLLWDRYPRVRAEIQPKINPFLAKLKLALKVSEATLKA
jgi:hypothetical protein